MSLSKQEIDELLRMIVLTRDEEISCETCLHRVAEFAEQALAGKSLPDSLKAVEYHLSLCRECREEYEALRGALRGLAGKSVTIRIKRVYDPPGEDDGLRVLVDRLWPRGLNKADARVDLWMKDLAPTATLRTWFGHDASRFSEFRCRYREELSSRRELAQELLEMAGGGTITLLFAARDPACNNAVVLREFLMDD